ncbi:DNA polymerase III subunit epsilon [Pontibacillus chungwhensis BH030062]|uniref:DNA polymerase III subunit epsilon n=1 Tax=Pontibacillus chungwhensis BH030062 TaxID=1385513 RepID=A0A0A2UVH4_9BACI|nr:3'-5' exonuclease [Pontibacillus chungwhensis]KGP91904.1 DNA polymerase III subunit epsilon [Pontibacillus chungwhensis BH030062]
MLPIDLEILKYIFFERHMYAYKLRPYLKTNKYHELHEKLSTQEHNEDLLKMNIQEAPFTIFDLETTGLLPELGHEIISIGAIRIQGTNHVSYKRFHQYVRPIRPVHQRTLNLTGMTRKDLQRGQTFLEAYDDFMEFSKDTILVAYPAAFDMKFLQTLLKRWKLPIDTPPSIDAQKLVKKMYPNHKYQLDSMIASFGITQLERHHALNDAIMTAELFQQILHDIHSYGIKTVEDAIHWIQS